MLYKENYEANPISHTDLTQKIYEILRNKIISGEIKPREKLTEERIAQYLAVSRTPLHRAFQMLQADLLIEQKPRRGFYVREYDVNEILDALEIRELLEGLAVRKLANHPAHKDIGQKLQKHFEDFISVAEINTETYRKNDQLFHLQIMELTDNALLIRLHNISHFLLHSFKPGLIRPAQETLPEHLKIIEYIKRGDAIKAEKAINEHISQSIKVFKKNYL
jgi:DNA-binding GntR family transcriptional regulator